MRKTLSNMRKVYQYGKKYKLKLIAINIATLISTIIGIILPLLIAKQIVYLTTSAWKQLILISLLLCAIELGKTLMVLLLFKRNNQSFIRATMKNLQMDLAKESLKIEQKEIENNSSGMFVQRMVNDTEKMASFIAWGGLKDLRIIITNLGSLFTIFLINQEVFLYYLFVTIILTLLYLRKTKKFGKENEKFKDKIEDVSSLTGELIRGIKDIKMLNSEDNFLKKLEVNINEQNQKRFDMVKINSIYLYTIDTLRAIFEFGLIILLMFLIKNKGLEIPIAIALFNYKSGIMTIVMEKFSIFLENVKEFDISCDRVFAIIDNKNFEKEIFGTSKIDSIQGNFEFKNVSFKYNENSPKVLDEMNFKINSGEMVGIVGKTGAGKTTIFNLLCKMFKINSGEILIDGINIEELDKESIRGNITIINQNPYIFNMSIKENLRLVKENLTEEEMKEACKMASLDKYIESLPNKYDTIVGEGGITLSGGQKQRLAIARAFAQKTKIILFDEATSALDSETQLEIQKAIENLKKDYTILIIAHRLSTIKNCNRIMYINNGKVLAEGSHEELFNNNNDYKNLCKNEIV